jgi:chorismate mutase-like protein
MKDIEKIRKKIDKIDQKLVKLVSERVRLIPAVAKYKVKNNLPMHNPKREKQIFENKVKLAKKEKVNPELVKDIFKRLIKESYRIEEKVIKKR